MRKQKIIIYFNFINNEKKTNKFLNILFTKKLTYFR